MNRCERPWCDNYLLVYSYQGRIHSQHEILHIKNYAEDHGLKLVSIFADYTWVDEVVVPVQMCGIRDYGYVSWNYHVNYYETEVLHHYTRFE